MVRANEVCGWAQNPDYPDAPVCLDILADGELVTRVLASLHRPDLAKAGIGDGHHAFVAKVATAGRHIEVRRSADQKPLRMPLAAAA